MINLIRRDFKFLSSSKGSLFSFLIMVPIFLFLMGNWAGPTIYAILTVVLVHTLTTLSFRHDTKSNSYILIKSLPIRDTDFVISKYVLIFINYIFVVGYILIIAILMDNFNLAEFNVNNFNMPIIIYILMINIISLSVCLPLIFFIPPKIGEAIGSVAMMITVNMGGFQLYLGGMINIELLAKFNNPKSILLVLLGMFASIGLSIYILSQKEY